MTTFRKARTQDFLAIAALDREAWRANRHAEFIPDGEHAWRQWVEHALVFCACDETGVLGAILAFPSLSGAYCLHKVFVRKDCRRQNVATRLFECLLKELDRLQADCFLTVDPANEKALSLYAKMGFSQRRFVKGFYREKEDRYVLTRPSQTRTQHAANERAQRTRRRERIT